MKLNKERHQPPQCDQYKRHAAGRARRPLIPLTLISALLSACAGTGPTGLPRTQAVPINSEKTLQLLSEYAQRAALQRDETASVAPHADTTSDSIARLFHSPAATTRTSRHNTGDHPNETPAAHKARHWLSTHTITVNFASNSREFSPDREQIQRMKQLIPMATHINVRGRTDGTGSARHDQHIAYQRALAARGYLLQHGAPHQRISVNYQAGGDPIANNDYTNGRRSNRRVEIEFQVPASTMNRDRNRIKDRQHTPDSATQTAQTTAPQLHITHEQRQSGQQTIPLEEQWQVIRPRDPYMDLDLDGWQIVPEVTAR